MSAEIVMAWKTWLSALLPGGRPVIRDERGEIAEKAIVVAGFAALAIALVIIITTKFIGVAESIPTE